jgi:osmotically-inducible protein OsmY
MKTPQDLKLDVEDELAWDKSFNATAIGVAVSDSAVTLTGHVSSYAEKRAAEKATKRVAGVVAVANDLEVRLPSSWQRDDTDIAKAVATELKWNANVPDSVTATVEKGWVTISGTVDWEFQRRAAEKEVRDLIGVKGITNLIVIKKTPVAADVKDKIYKAFHRSAQVDADHVNVGVVDGRVTLTGNVHSWSERMEAQHAAAAAPGVTSVDNKLHIESYVPGLL